MKLKLFSALVLVVVVGASCTAKKNAATDWAAAAQNAETAEGHQALANHYDELAKAAEANAEEQRRLLADYQARPHRYGRRIKDLRARSGALLRDYESEAKDAREMADVYRQIASEFGAK